MNTMCMSGCGFGGAKDRPLNIRPQFFAGDNFAAFFRGALNQRAFLGGDATIRVEPWPDVTTIRVAANGGEGGLAAEDVSGSFKCGLLSEKRCVHAESLRHVDDWRQLYVDRRFSESLRCSA